MKTRTLVIAATVGAGLLLSGCEQVKKLVGGKPSGQVVATVDGKEITNLELRAELGGFGSRDPAIMKAAQQQALQQIILRKVLAEAARKDKLDKGTDFTLQVSRGEETLLAQLYQRKLAAKVVTPSKQEAEAFIASHPDMFANRKVLFLDQIIAAPNKIPPERFRPLNTLPQVKALLDAEGVQYQENAATLDTLSANQQLVAQINMLPPGEVFVVPQNGSILFNQVSGARVVPFKGDTAIAFATNTLRGQKSQQSVGKQIEAMRKAAESTIVYNAAFKPPAKGAVKAPASKASVPAAPAPAAPAPAASPAGK